MNRRGGRLLVCLLLLLLSVHLIRVFRASMEDPDFLSQASPGVMVELGSGFEDYAIHQFFDGTTVGAVIKMTNRGYAEKESLADLLQKPIESGSRIDLELENLQIKGVRLSWMSAAKRVALGIPLHPDRMTEVDWIFLPGVGGSMAHAIEMNRQKYGDFHTFDNMVRVAGLGQKRISRWNQYFFSPETDR